MGKLTDTERSALIEELAEANNEQPEGWPTSLCGKTPAKAQRSRITYHLETEKDVLNGVRKAMR